MSSVDLRPLRIIAGEGAEVPRATGGRAARRGFDYAQLLRRAPAPVAPAAHDADPRRERRPSRDAATPFAREPDALPDAQGRQAMARACAGADGFVNQVFAQQERMVRIADTLAGEIAALCAEDAGAQWDLSMPLDPALLPATLLHVALSHFDLRLRFETADAATRQLLSTHRALLHARLDTLLAHLGVPRAIDIDVA
ncbi:type III secretion system protein SctP [Burkholderia sp. FERM BP-3421]|jgi:type III secretion control protein HpaP|uniref:type III secretion system protein SctP n=1 Tax=Burkholderia sp. FERM BP-3421 TaxID=1494466 RepID=UPI00236048D6|nr:type III secretion system protein SctP [Burkholderia sp. FERM BP-3421]WDD92580.1 type III secretion system protein SctP [Burkholderia sp. FERM BP-3421]